MKHLYTTLFFFFSISSYSAPLLIKDGKLQSDLDADGNTVSNLAAPVSDDDAATKSYVDSSSGLPTPTADGSILVSSGGSFNEVLSGAIPFIDTPFGFASGDIIYHNGTGEARLPKGTDGQALILASGFPAWTTLPSGSGGTIDDGTAIENINHNTSNTLGSYAVSLQAYASGGGRAALANYSGVLSGADNYVSVGGLYGVVGGGQSNAIGNTGDWGFIGGGLSNVVSGNYAFAGGLRAKANHNGTFIFGDSTNADITTDAVNQVKFRANGGFTITNSNGSITIWGKYPTASLPTARGNGDLVFDTTANVYKFWDGSAWTAL